MKRIKVESSNLANIGYDRCEMILEIEFKNGLVYHYFDVYPDDYIGLMNAESIGKYFNLCIKNHRYEKVS